MRAKKEKKVGQKSLLYFFYFKMLVKCSALGGCLLLMSFLITQTLILLCFNSGFLQMCEMYMSVTLVLDC